MSREVLLMLSWGGLYSGWVLLPIIPSVLIYWLFPNTAVAVSGPLANLTLRASGAFAAYLVIFVASYVLVQKVEDTIGSFEHPFWTITGHVRLVDHQGQEQQSEELWSHLVTRTVPDPFTVNGDIFEMNIPERDGFPVLILEIPKFGVKRIELKNLGGVKLDAFHKTIEFSQPITIRELQDTAPNSQLRPIAASGAGDSGQLPVAAHTP